MYYKRFEKYVKRSTRKVDTAKIGLYSALNPIVCIPVYTFIKKS